MNTNLKPAPLLSDSYEIKEDLVSINGCSLEHRGRIHSFGGYNFVELTVLKCNPELKTSEDDIGGKEFIFALQKKYNSTTQNYEEVPVFEEHRMKYVRFIGSSLAYVKEYESAYSFGGYFEEVGENADNSSLYSSNRLFEHVFSDGALPIMTNVLPSSIYQPSPRAFQAAAWDNDRMCLWILGGGRVVNSARPILLNDLWKWSSISGTWTYIKTENTPSHRWGHKMLYFNNRLYLYGGETQKKSKNQKIFIFDVTGKKTSWTSKSLPKTNQQNGSTMDLIIIPGLGPRIIILGGHRKSINSELTFNGNIKVDLSFEPKLEPLMMTVFNPLAVNSEDQPEYYEFKEDIHQKFISNYAYHSSIVMNGDIYLIGGLNTVHGYDTGALSKQITRLHIFDFLKSKFVQNQTLYTINEIYHKPETHSRLSEPNMSRISQAILNETNKYNNSESAKYLAQFFVNHQTKPIPRSDFVVIGRTFVQKNILNARIPKATGEIFSLSPGFSEDFSCFIYTGSIDISTSDNRFTSFDDFLALFKVSLDCSFYRLIWIELGLHLSKLTVDEILKLCTLKGTDGQLVMENSCLQILKYLFHNVLKDYFDHISEANLEEMGKDPKVSALIVEYMWGESIKEPPIPKKLPSSSVIFDLALELPNTTVECIGGSIIAYCNYAMPGLPEKIKYDSSIVRAVLRRNSDFIFEGLSSDTEKILRFVQTLEMINEHTTMTADLMTRLFMRQSSVLRHLMVSGNELRAKLRQFLPSIKSIHLLAFVIQLFGISRTVELIALHGRTVIVHREILNPSIKGTRFVMDTKIEMVYAMLAMAITKCSLTELPCGINPGDFSWAVLTMANHSQNMVPPEICAQVREFFLEHTELMEKIDLLKQFRGAAHLEILGDVESLGKNDPTWIQKVPFTDALSTEQLRRILAARMKVD